MSPRECAAFAVLGAVLAIALMMLVGGCRHGAAFVDGTRFRFGVYVPVDGQLYGLQILEYINGTACVTTNSNMSVTRSHAATNSYLGAVHTVERTETSARVR